MREPEALTKAELVAVIRAICSALYADGPGTQWDSDTPVAVHDVLNDYGLAPKE